MARILVTNDDGIDSPGLHALAAALVPLGEVIVFAPSGEYSGAGASIGYIGAGVPHVHRVQRPELAGVAASYHLDGPPALAALLALRGLFGAVPDVVVSGINPGWNVGLAVHFSGTVGAAVTAQQLGVPGVAVSQHSGEVHRWDTAARVAADVVAEQLAAVGAGGDVHALSVNVPNVAIGQLAGMRHTRLSDRLPYRMRGVRMANLDGHEHRFEVGFDRDGDYDASEGTDTAAVEAGYVSITRLRPTSAW
ncbi:MAG: 5'/3'-nucleotidase SurE [Acidimicrobiia bacterium]|nr:5'/3'-nucleotidase SurE [Acidimicrobiia bacterium]